MTIRIARTLNAPIQAESRPAEPLIPAHAREPHRRVLSLGPGGPLAEPQFAGVKPAGASAGVSLAGPRARALRYPVLLVHGFAGPSVDRSGAEYWGDIPALLRSKGIHVVTPDLPPFAGSNRRVRHLAKAVRATLASTGASKVHIIAHSQGGLDARGLLGRHRYGDRIASVTTISTPHRGLVMADALDMLDETMLRTVLPMVGFDITWREDIGGIDLKGALKSASARRLSADEPRNRPSGDVPFFSVAAYTGDVAPTICEGPGGDKPLGVDQPNPRVALLGGGLRLLVGSNDGLIPTASARWGQFLGCIPADHIDQVGGVVGNADERFDYVALYERLVANLQRLERAGPVEDDPAPGMAY